MSKLRIALIGNGGICRGCHVNNYYEDGRAEIVLSAILLKKEQLHSGINTTLMQQYTQIIRSF